MNIVSTLEVNEENAYYLYRTKDSIVMIKDEGILKVNRNETIITFAKGDKTDEYN